jgi:hypothetical protein
MTSGGIPKPILTKPASFRRSGSLRAATRWLSTVGRAKGKSRAQSVDGYTPLLDIPDWDDDFSASVNHMLHKVYTPSAGSAPPDYPGHHSTSPHHFAFEEVRCPNAPLTHSLPPVLLGPMSG